MTSEQQGERPAKNRRGLIRKVAIPKKQPLSSYLEQMGLVLREEDGQKIARAISGHPLVKISDQEKLIGEAIKRARKERRLTQQQMSKLFGISDQTFGRYERGAHVLTLGTFINICEILGCMPIELMGEATPQLWGKDEATTKKKLALTRLVSEMPDEKLDLVLQLVKTLASKDD